MLGELTLQVRRMRLKVRKRLRVTSGHSCTEVVFLGSPSVFGGSHMSVLVVYVSLHDVSY